MLATSQKTLKMIATKNFTRRADRVVGGLIALLQHREGAREKMMVMIRVSWMGDGDVAHAAAVKLITNIAEAYQANTIAADKLYESRDTMLNQMGVDVVLDTTKQTTK